MQDYRERIRDVVQYIEGNLTASLSFAEICGRSFLSPYHFHRVFQAAVGDTAGNYTRKRRLSEAARDLVQGDERIIEIALKYGYESQAAFARAFKKQFHDTPAAYRKAGNLKLIYSESPLEEIRLLHLAGGISTEPVVVDVAPVQVVGMDDAITFEHNRMPEIWDTFRKRMDEIPRAARPPTHYGFYGDAAGIGADDLTKDSPIEVLVSTAVDQAPGEPPPGMVTRRFAGGRYARFVHRGDVGRIEHSYRFIYGTWLNKTDLRLAPRMSFERFDERFQAEEKVNSEFEIYIPVE